MENLLEKIFNLVKKTGDKFIVLEKDGNPGYVIMRFRDYERLVLAGAAVFSLTEEEFLDKINSDIALWKASQEEWQLNNWQVIQSAIQEAKQAKQKEEDPFGEIEQEQEENKYYFEPVE